MKVFERNGMPQGNYWVNQENLFLGGFVFVVWHSKFINPIATFKTKEAAVNFVNETLLEGC